MSMTHSDDFSARLARVKANTGRSVIMVGQDESFVRERKVTVAVSRPREIGSNLVYPGTLVGAFLMGMFAVALGQYVRFHLFSEGVELADSDLEMALAGGIGLMASFALSQMFRLTSKAHRSMQAAGVFAMVCTFHNLGHWFPGPMSAAFSPQWVAQIQTTSPANSFRLSGRYIPFGQTAAAPDAVAGLVPVEMADKDSTGTTTADCTRSQPAVPRIVLDSDKDKTPGTTGSAAKTIAVTENCSAD